MAEVDRSNGDPLSLFRDWFSKARETSPARHVGAVCLSTVDETGTPEARFIDLKAVTDVGFVFCTQYDSPKGVSLAANPRVALTFWWDHVERQVRITGSATRLADEESDRLFQQRPREAQLTSLTCHQSAPLTDAAELEQRLNSVRSRFSDVPIPRPSNWGGYLVLPEHIEFLAFRANRMHERSLFLRRETTWEALSLEP